MEGQHFKRNNPGSLEKTKSLKGIMGILKKTSCFRMTGKDINSVKQ